MQKFFRMLGLLFLHNVFVLNAFILGAELTKQFSKETLVQFLIIGCLWFFTGSAIILGLCDPNSENKEENTGGKIDEE